MPDSVLEEIERGWKLFQEGRQEEALILADEVEKQGEISPKEKFRLQILKGLCYSVLEPKKSFKIVKEVERESEKLGNKFLLIEVINLKLQILAHQGKFIGDSALDLIRRGDIIYNSISNNILSENINKAVCFLSLKAMIYFNNRIYDRAEESNKKAIELIYNNDFDYPVRRDAVTLMGHINTVKGNPSLALEYHEKSLALRIGDTDLENLRDINDFWGMGYAFYLKGDLDNSLKYFKQSLTGLEKHNLFFREPGHSSAALGGIIRVLIAKDDNEGTQHFLDLFKNLNDKRPIESIVSYYHLLRAKMLKSSTRSRDRAEAEKIFKEIIEKGTKLPRLVNNALTGICDLYLNELKLTNDLTIIDEINPFISRLIENAEKYNPYSLLARTKLLQARIALIQMNMGEAQRFLTQAQKIADEKGYQHLAQTISLEHDNLLGQLGVWENLKKTNAPLSERMNLASLSGSIENLIETQETNIPEVIKEQPVLLLVLIEGGVLLLSYPFTDEWKSNDELFGSFLTAFMSFSNEFFTEGLDRAKFGQYTVLMETISKYSICYLYKGQTYLAKKKLGYFIERLQNVPSIMKTFDKFYETSQVIELKNFPFLEGFITEIFMSKNPGNIVT